MPHSHRFLNACRCQPVDRVPIWLMRQAGRYMPEYRALRAEHSLSELIKTPELAAEVTFQPITAFGLDAAIIFADILPLLEGMGLELEFAPGQGPRIHNPVRIPADIERLTERSPEEALPFTLEAIRLVQRELAGALPLIGFSGAPFTLACYATEGGSSRQFPSARQLMHEEPGAWHRLMEKLARAVGAYLVAQAQAGADAVQLFDTWAGLLSPDDYREYVFPYSRDVIRAVHAATEVPVIHFARGAAELLPAWKELGSEVLSIDWRVDLTDARRQVGDHVALQGNLDPSVLLTSVPEIEQQAAAVLQSAGAKPGYIFNLGHGVLKETPVENVRALVDFVQGHAS